MNAQLNEIKQSKKNSIKNMQDLNFAGQVKKLNIHRYDLAHENLKKVTELALNLKFGSKTVNLPPLASPKFQKCGF